MRHTERKRVRHREKESETHRVRHTERKRAKGGDTDPGGVPTHMPSQLHSGPSVARQGFGGSTN